MNKTELDKIKSELIDEGRDTSDYNLTMRLSKDINGFDISYEDMVKLGLHYDLSETSLSNTFWKTFYIFSKDNNDIGFVRINKCLHDRKIDIEMLYVKQSERQKGYGQKILEEIIKEMFHQCFFKISIGADSDNETALKLYRNMFPDEVVLKRETIKNGHILDRHIFSMFGAVEDYSERLNMTTQKEGGGQQMNTIKILVDPDMPKQRKKLKVYKEINSGFDYYCFSISMAYQKIKNPVTNFYKIYFKPKKRMHHE